MFINLLFVNFWFAVFNSSIQSVMLIKKSNDEEVCELKAIIDVMEISSYFLVFSLFIIFIIIFLWGTSCSNLPAIHKVIFLLLLSLAVIFLWIVETQFLFIYLVYILAFIGAVLMLFLSVVLMLPISTFRGGDNRFQSFCLVVFLHNFSIVDWDNNSGGMFDTMGVSLTGLLVCAGFIVILGFYCCFFNIITSRAMVFCSVVVCSFLVALIVFGGRGDIFLFGSVLLMSFLSFIYSWLIAVVVLFIYYVRSIPNEWVTILFFSNSNRTKSWYLFFSHSFYFSKMWIFRQVKLDLVKFYSFVKSCYIYLVFIFELCMSVGLLENIVSILQLCLRLGLFFVVLPPVWEPFALSNFFVIGSNSLYFFDLGPGLPILKELLYTQPYYWFLIISIFVLLSALIGAAIMTRRR